MLADSQGRGAWSGGLARENWSAEDRPYAVLLDALARDLASVATTELEMDARSRRSIAEVKQEGEELTRDRLEDARRELAAFRGALEAVRSQGASAEVRFDSVDPRQDAAAGLLIQYLVRPGYAQVRTKPRQRSGYAGLHSRWKENSPSRAVSWKETQAAARMTRARMSSRSTRRPASCGKRRVTRRRAPPGRPRLQDAAT